MCGAPERLTAFAARTFLVLYMITIMDQKVQPLKPLNYVSCIPRSRTLKCSSCL
jgi:hypothetical protein